MRRDDRRGVTQAPSADPGRVSVVLIARNVEQLLPGQLEALSRQTYTGPWEVVLVDNGSTDQTASIARSWAGRLPSLRIVDGAGVRGVNHARNVGARSASGDLLLFCDADDVADAGWVAAMARAGREHDGIGGYLDEATLNNPLVRAWRPPATLAGLPNKIFLPYPMGANAGVRASVFRALGGFKRSYTRGGEEVEFFWRLQLAGYSLGYAPDAIMHYRHRSDLRGLMRQYYRYGRSSVQLYKDFRPHGRERATIADVVQAWGPLLSHIPHLMNPARRGDWFRTLAVRAGQVHGSIVHGKLFIS